MLFLLKIIITTLLCSNTLVNSENTEKIETYRSGYFYEYCIFNHPMEEFSEIKTDICKLQNKTDEVIKRLNDKSDSTLNILILILSILGAISSYEQSKRK